jgi:hypothetical protein
MLAKSLPPRTLPSPLPSSPTDTDLANPAEAAVDEDTADCWNDDEAAEDAATEDVADEPDVDETD